MGTSSRRRFLRSLAAASVVMSVSGAARAGEVTAKIVLGKTRARVGEGVGMTLSVTSSSSDVPEPVLPDGLDESFEVVRPQTGHRSSAVLRNGRFDRSMTRTLRAVIIPSRPGKHSLAFSVAVGDETIRSNTIELEVVEGQTIELAEPDTGKPAQPRGDVFLWSSVDKTTVYVGEQITYRLDVYERRQFLNMHLRKTPAFTDFFTEELPAGEPTLEDVGGVSYRVRPGLSRALFPQKAGTSTIGPAEIAIGLRRHERSQPIEVEVLPLPAEGQPSRFSPNNVGQYALEADVDRTDLDPGDPFTLVVTIEGTGNIAFIDPGPWPEIEGARRYDPKVETERTGEHRIGGKRTYSFLIIPERAGKLVIPSHELHYFDPEKKAYETARSEPIELQIGEAGAQVAPVVDEIAEPTQDQEGQPLAEIIVADTVPRRRPRERWLTSTGWSYGMVAVPVLAGLGWGAGALWRRFGPDERARERVRERARRRALLDEARRAVESGEGFYAAVTRLLQEVAVQRAGPDGIGLPRPELLSLLERQGVKREVCRALEELLDRCDAARFGARSGSHGERQALLDEAIALTRSSGLVSGGMS